VRHSAGHVVAAIAIVSADSSSTAEWIMGSAAACDPSEFEPTVTTADHPFGIWSDAGGVVVPASKVRGIVDCYRGTQVRVDGRLYVRIPDGGVDPSQLEASWRADVPLPDSAVDTGYRSGNTRLYRAANGSALYVATGDRA